MKKEQLKNMIDPFVLEEEMNEKAKKTTEHYRHVVTMFVDFLQSEDVDKKDTMLFKKWLMGEYAPSTISNYITIVNKFIKYVEIMESNGEYDIEDLKKHRSKMTVKNIKVQQKASLEEVLEPAEFKRLLRMAKKKGYMDMYLIMKIFAYTGIRVAELKYFTVEALKTNYIEVNNKGKIRNIILRQDLRKELIEYCKKEGITGGYIFPGRTPGKMIHETTIWKRLKKIAGMCRGIKKEKVHAHSFRHLFAIKFKEEGGGDTELADILGHASVETTRIYARTTDYMKRKRLEKMKY